jgi:peptidoglycan hydrolase-like protein with peptidoglycan-binding domain
MFLPSNITLQFGDSGDFVSELQRRLALVHCFSDAMISGFYDGPTVNGVTLFQSQCGLRADGVAGPETLRRLNSSIAGDSTSSGGSGGTSDSNQEEEKRAAQQQEFLKTEIVAHNVIEQAAWNTPAAADIAPATPYAPPAFGGSAAPAASAAPDMAAQQMAATQQQFLNTEIIAAQQQQLQQQLQSAPPPPMQSQGNDPLAMLATTAQPQAQEAQQQPSNELIPSQASQQRVPAPATPNQLVPIADAAPQQGQNLIQRTISAASGMVQKLANYFEAKLPPDTLREGKEIGQTMAQSGVKESTLPADPTAARAPEQPARGPAQQQTQQRS